MRPRVSSPVEGSPGRFLGTATSATLCPVRIAVLTSGGDAPGMNSALSGAVKAAAVRGHDIVGIRDGYTGLLDGRSEPLDLIRATGIIQMGGTVLGSAREPRMTKPEGREAALAALVKLGCEALVVVGGNGSLTGAHLLAEASQEVRVVGLPASIDNDIGHTRMAIGVDTAINTIVEACDRISDTATAHRRVFVVEVMGRESGFLAMRAGTAVEAEAILCTENDRPKSEVLERLRGVIRRSFDPSRQKRRVLVIRAEGASISTQELVEGLRAHLAEDAPGVSVRETVLGHLVRGGRPSQYDRVMGQRLGFGAVLALEAGHHGVMLGWDVPGEAGQATPDGRVRAVDFGEVLEETRRLLDGTSPVAEARLRLLQMADEAIAL